MPRGDRTGPMGMGSMTGRGAGFCSGNTVPGYMNPGYGSGFWGQGRGGGRGRGRGWGNWFGRPGLPGWQSVDPSVYGPAYAYPPSAPNLTREQEIGTLKGEAEYLGNALEDVKKRIEELESKAE